MTVLAPTLKKAPNLLQQQQYKEDSPMKNRPALGNKKPNAVPLASIPQFRNKEFSPELAAVPPNKPVKKVPAKGPVTLIPPKRHGLLIKTPVVPAAPKQTKIPHPNVSKQPTPLVKKNVSSICRAPNDTVLFDKNNLEHIKKLK